MNNFEIEHAVGKYIIIYLCERIYKFGDFMGRVSLKNLLVKSVVGKHEEVLRKRTETLAPNREIWALAGRKGEKKPFGTSALCKNKIKAF